MKLLFLGDSMFGRDNHKFTENPYVDVVPFLENAEHIIFNLETVLSEPPLSREFKVNKTFNYQSSAKPLRTLKEITKKHHTELYASVANNHSLDFGEKGHENTKRILKKLDIKCNSKQKVETKEVIFMNSTDHCGCDNPSRWAQQISFIDYKDKKQIQNILQKVKRLRTKNKKKCIVYSIHWGPNWVPDKLSDEIIKFGRDLIDSGVDIVFGHSAHHIVKEPTEEYNGGLIIYGLGDFINDYSVDPQYQSDKALMCSVSLKKNSLTYELIPVKRVFVEEGGSIPFLI